MKFEALFQPLKIGGMEVKNRIAMPPMGSNMADENFCVTSRMAEYYKIRSRGGFGLITVEITAVSPTGGAIAREAGLWKDEQVLGYRKLAAAIHAGGAKMSVQLHHAGRQTFPSLIGGQQPVAPSPIPCPYCKVMPREMSTKECYEMIDNFVDAAERAKTAGADAVEVHGAHGYLVAQFMSAYSNRRTDEFGGSLHNRMRFPKLIIEGIRERLGPGFPIIFRISGEEKAVAGRALDETRAICLMLEEFGVDAIDVSMGVYGQFPWIWGAGDMPYAYEAQYAQDIKRSLGIPVISVGRILDPAVAWELVESGRVDMVALGRQSLADPEWPNKVMNGQYDEISPCIACHQGCTEEMFKGNAITCVINPLAGNEEAMKIEPAALRKKVIVVGAGPGGLYAAMLMARRGHNVSIYEKSDKPGGQMEIASIPPAKADFVSAVAYYRHMCEKYGVEFHMGTEATSDLIYVKRPDAVVLATGGVPMMPNIEGINTPSLLKATDILAGRTTLPQGRVLIAGGGMTGVEIADYLGQYGCVPTIVELKDEVGADVNETVKITLMPRLADYGTEFVAGTRIKRFTADGAVCEKDGREFVLSGFDSVVLALGTEAYNPLESEMRRVLSEVYVIGDASYAGKLLDATRAALKIALDI